MISKKFIYFQMAALKKHNQKQNNYMRRKTKIGTKTSNSMKLYI